MSNAQPIVNDDVTADDLRGDSRVARMRRAKASGQEPKPYPGLRALIRGDIQVWGEQLAGKKLGEPVRLKTAIRMVLVYAGLRTALLHRLAFAADRAWIPVLPLILSNLNLTLHGFDMPSHIEVGPRFFVPHPVGTVVTAQRIGSGATLVSAITIGMRNGSDFPVLGDDVYVGAGARILGEVTVGDRAQIGANAVVLKDVPADHVAIGVPAKIRPASPLAE
jgi:serine O-acetyltransferase